MSSLKAAVRIHRRIAEVGREAWDACAGAGNPFVSFDFLDVLAPVFLVAALAAWTAAFVGLLRQLARRARGLSSRPSSP